MNNKLPLKHLLPASVRRTMWLSALSPLMVFAGSAYAQVEEQTEERLEEVIVTGVVNTISKKDATFSVNTLDTAQIQQLAPISTADLLQNIPGIYAEGSTAGEASNNITVRGLPVTGGFRYAPQLIDGLPWFEEPEVQFMNNDSAARFDLMTERVEVVKGGTGGILYSNGLGATVNHVTRRGGQQFEGAYRGEVADYNFIRNEGYISGPISDSLTYAVGGYYRTSDGIRDTGYKADHGGQIRANLQWLSDDDRSEVFVQLHKINDHTGFNQNVPFQVPAFSDSGTPDNPTRIQQVWPLGIDFADGTVASPYNRRFTQLGEYGSRAIDLEDGLHADFDIFTLKFNHEFENGWRASGGFRRTTGDNDFNAMFTGNDSSSASRFLNARWINDVVNPAYGAALGGNYETAKLAGYFSMPADPASAFSGISRDEFVDQFALGTGVGAFYADGTQVADDTVVNFLLPFIANTSADSRSIDFNLQKSFEFFGSHDITVGIYDSRYSTDQSFQSSLLVSSMERESRLLDLYVVNDAGDRIGPSLTLDGAFLPGFFGYTSDFEGDGRAYYVLDHWETMDGRLKIDAGLRWQQIEANAFRQSRNLTADSNFTPEGVVPGSADDLTVADDEIQLPSNPQSANNRFSANGWSLGANYSVADNFAIYALASDLFRLPSLEDYNEFRVSDDSALSQVETIKQYEMGLRYYAETWDTQIALFYNEFSPKQDSVRYRDFTSPDCGVAGGIAEINQCPEVLETFRRGVQNEGVEIELSWRPDFDFTRGLEFNFNAVVQSPEIVDANYTVVNSIVENDILVGYEFRQIGENGRTPRRLSEEMVNLQGVWDMKPILGVPFKPYFKYTYFGERYSESRDFDVTLYPEYFHVDAGFIWDFSQALSAQLHVSNLTDELSFTEGDPLIPSLKGPNGATNRGVGRPLFGRVVRAMINYRF